MSTYIEVKVTQSCPALGDPMNYSLSDSSAHGILQARVLEWVAFPFSRESSQPRDRTQVSHIVGGFFISWVESRIYKIYKEHKYIYIYIYSFLLYILSIPWCWERLRVRGEGDDRGWDGWVASLTRQTWVWASSGSWWWTGTPGVL